jgi:cell division protein FtsN
MSRDYKPSAERSKKSGGSPLFTGLLVGVLLGIAASLMVVMFLKGGDSPFNNKAGMETSKSKAKNKAETKPDEPGADTSALPTAENPANKDKTRFDFYTILPGSETKVTEEEQTKIKDQKPVVEEAYFLQVGAFQTENEADNMKAKLALQGFEAVVQTATLPEKGIWHRVRVGPLKDAEQISKTKTELASNGFKADLIKVNTNNQ